MERYGSWNTSLESFSSWTSLRELQENRRRVTHDTHDNSLIRKFEGSTARFKHDPMTSRIYAKHLDNDFEIIDRVVELAKKKNISPSQLSLAWLLHKPQVVAPIIGEKICKF